MNIKKILRLLICLILIFQIIISSCVNSYGFYAVPFYVIEAIAQVALANGVRLGEENKGDIAEDIYNDMTPECREQFDRDCRVLAGNANSEDYLTAEAPLVFMTLTSFAMISHAINNYFNNKIDNGTYSIETEAIPTEEIYVHRTISELETAISSYYGNNLPPSRPNAISSQILNSDFNDFTVVLCSDWANTPTFMLVCGDFSLFNSVLHPEVYKNGDFEDLCYIFTHAYYKLYYNNYSTEFVCKLPETFKKKSEDNYVYSTGYYIPVSSYSNGSILKIHTVPEDFIGPLPSGSDIVKKLKLGNGSYIQLEKENVIETEDYIDDLAAKLKQEEKIVTTATGEEKVILKPADTLTDKPIDVFADPKTIDLTGYEEKEITAEPPVAIEEPVLDTTLDTTDIFTTIKSFFQNFWTNTKAIFSNLWNWLKRIYTAITSIGTKLATFDLSALFKKYFVPDFTSAYKLKSLLMQKFGIISQLEELYMGFFNFSDDKPRIEITYMGVTGEIVDFDIYDQNKEYIDSVIIAIAYFTLIRKIIKKIPSMIGGI